jgi:hypothetical protein
MGKKEKGKKNIPSTDQKDSPLYTIYVIFCVTLLVANILLILSVFYGSGWDMSVYYSAVIATLNHQNPYNVENINLYSGLPGFPFVYPPHTLVLFFLMMLFRFFYIYYIIWTVLLIISCYIVWKFDKTDTLLMVTTLSTGFISVFWSYLTGNMGIIYLFLFSLLFYFLYTKRHYISSVMLGLAASIYIFPLLFSFLYSFLPLKRTKKIFTILLPFIVVGIIFALSYIISPTLVQDYIQETVSANTLMEGSGTGLPVSYYINTPTSYWFFNHFLNFFHLANSPALYVLGILFIGTIGGLFYVFYRDNQSKSLELFCYGMIGLFLILPRLKPYNFILILIPIYLLIRGYSLKNKMIGLTIMGLLPLILYLVHRLYFQDIITAFNQFLLALLIYIFIGILSHTNKFHGNTGGERGK